MLSNSSDKENDEGMSGSRTPTGSYMYTPISGSASLSGSGSGGGGVVDSSNLSRDPAAVDRVACL